MTKNFLAKTLFLVFLLSAYFQAHTQLVNIEKERKTIKSGLQGSLSFAFNITQNTRSIIQGNNNTNIQFITKNMKNTFLILNDYTIMKVMKQQNNFDLINKNFQHFRYNYAFSDTTKKHFGAYVYELFFQRQQNKIKYIKLRLLWGTGMRFRIINSKTLIIFLCPLIMYEYEKLSDSAHTITKTIKGDFYTSINLKINDLILFTNVTYYEPALINLNPNISNFEPISDFRLYSENSLTFNLIKNRLQFMIIFSLAYDSRPPVELINRPLFYNFKNALSIKF